MVWRAGGRRRLHGVKRVRAAARRHQLVHLLTTEELTYGSRVRWAKRLGVAPSTITADLYQILRVPPRPRDDSPPDPR